MFDRNNWRSSFGGCFRDEAAVDGRRGKHFAALLRHGLRGPLDIRLDGRDVVVILEMFQEIADVQEGVAIEADIHEGRLHSRKNACDPTLVETSD